MTPFCPTFEKCQPTLRTHPPHNCIGADQFCQYPIRASSHHPCCTAVSADQVYVLELVIAPFHALSNHVISYLDSNICNQLQIWKMRITCYDDCLITR